MTIVYIMEAFMLSPNKKILVILGHPHGESLSASLGRAYAEGARESGAETRVLSLSDLKFDPVLRAGYRQLQALEPDLVEAQNQIAWAYHIVIVFPIWWGGVPALLKGFLDRAILPGFGFRYRSNSSYWDKLLTGKTARLIVLSDAPSFWVRLVQGDAAVKMMKKSTLEFCGIKPVRISRFDRIKFSTPERRAQWISQVRDLGFGNQ